MRHQAEKERRGLGQRDAQRVIIHGFDPDVLGLYRHQFLVCDRRLQRRFLIQETVSSLFIRRQHNPRRMHQAMELGIRIGSLIFRNRRVLGSN